MYTSVLLFWVSQISIHFFLRRMGVNLQRSTVFLGDPIVSLSEGSHFSIGANCLICSKSEMTALGVNHPCVFRTLRPEATLSIGEGVRMSGVSICAGVRVEIGDHVVIGANAVIVDTDFHSLDPLLRNSERDEDGAECAPVCIDEDVFIGMNAIILKGVTIGRGSVIAAGAVVTKSCPPFSIMGGNPAIVIGPVQTFK